jgi:hypothetical protein
LTAKKGILLSGVAISSSANSHDVKMVTYVNSGAFIRRRLPPLSVPKAEKGRGRRRLQHLCVLKAHNSKEAEQKLIKRGQVFHLYHTKEKE